MMANKDLSSVDWGKEVDQSLAIRKARKEQAEREARKLKISKLLKLRENLKRNRRVAAPREIDISERQQARIKSREQKENFLSQGILAVSGQQQQLLEHLGIKSFIVIMRSEGLLGSSLEKSLQNLFIWMSSYQKINLSLGDKSQRARQGREIAQLLELQKKINLQINTVQTILSKAGNIVNRMQQNLLVFIDDEDKLLSLLRRNRGNLDHSELPAVAKTALRYFKRQVLPVYKDLSVGFRKLRENTLQLLENSWKKVQAGKEPSLDAPQKYYQIMVKNINEVLAAAERSWKVEEQEKQYLQIIENLAIKIVSSANVQRAPERGKPASVRISEAAVQPGRKAGQKAYAGERISIAQPAQQENKWYKPWTWFR